MKLWGNKRGGTQKSYFTLIDLILLVIIAVGFTMFVAQIANSTLLEKNYLARDIALLVDTAYASPGQLNYVYERDISRYIVAFEDNHVKVRTESDVIPKQYWFADSDPVSLFEEAYNPEELVLIGARNQVLVKNSVTS